MRITSFIAMAMILASGCADSTIESESEVGDSSPVGDTVARHPYAPTAGPPDSGEFASGAVESDEATDDDLDDATDETVVNAEALLASTLKKAQTADKRVMIHLGAPW